MSPSQGGDPTPRGDDHSQEEREVPANRKRRMPKDPLSPVYAELRTPTSLAEDAKVLPRKIPDDAEPVAQEEANAASKIVPLSTLFSFADKTDKVLMAVGSIGALVAGLGQPVQIVLIGNVMNAFNPTDLPDADTMKRNVNSVALNFVWVGLGMIVGGFIQVACWSLTASRQAKRIRSSYVNAILAKDIGWFDVSDPKQLATRVADSTVTLQEGMGRKIGDGLHFFSMGFAGIVIGLTKGWELALVLLAFTPLIAATAFVSMKFMATATQTGIESYGIAGAIAQEALGNVRTVHMFNSISHFVQKYGAALEMSTKAGIKKGFAVGWGTGIMFFTIYCTYAAGLYFGAVQISNDQLSGSQCTGHGCYDGGKVITIFFAIIMGAMALGQAGPSVQAIYAARACAHDVFRVINEKSAINPLEANGRRLDQVAGAICLSDIMFAYPSRPEINVCSGYSLTIEAGETIALVGPSGSGKSTIISLLERFYDPQAGSVQIDGVDIRELNVKWLRQQIGLVGQEPALFATSILENIRHGAPDATNEQVYEAAKKANAFTFIMSFPQGFDTEVGERGIQLSGGQKQRIAIARAIIKNPPILLLDEATSALDTESERVVQKSLDTLLATSKRTTIIVAHRLSTIQGADRIAVHNGGQIVEIGSHDELMAIRSGHYKNLVELQRRDIDREDPTISERSEENSSQLVPVPTKISPESGLKRRASVHSEKQFVPDGEEESQADDEATCHVPASRIWKLSRPEWRFLVLGGFGAVLNAAVFPLWGVILSKIIVLLFDYSKSPDEMRADARLWSLAFVILGLLFGVAIIMQNYGFAVASQNLVSRVRFQTFQSMLEQEIAWFDLDENTSGALVSRLATDSATLQAITSDTLNQGLVNITTLCIGLSICFYYSWQMSLAALSMLPVMMLFATVQSKAQTGNLNNRKNNNADIAAGSLLSESIESIRTVASFSMEYAITTAYIAFLDVSKHADIKVGIIGGATFGVSQGAMYISIAFLFWLGGKWVAEKTITFEDMFMVMMVLVMSTFAVGLAAQNLTDSSKAKKAAQNVFQVIDRVPAIDSSAPTGDIPSTLTGEIEFHNVAFTYPSRPDAQIYRNYSLKVASGQTVALVGASGSGKSTAIALLERFYDPSAGVVTLDGKNIRDLNVTWLRERISLVSQEPVLFSGTIADNIGMGKPGATRDDIIDAATKANAHGFIANFPLSYDTEVGDRGAQVSGGQKQRIAIARAILRDPDVLLLDEATSALDNESERVVQESLDRLLALKKRTTIIVAHRLSTIRNADLIAVTRNGAIVEQGTHSQLMELHDGVYKSLVARQMSAAC